MLECEGCHRYIHATESSCPFCTAPVTLTAAVSLGRAPMVAFAAGLSLLACKESDDEAGDASTTGNDNLDYSGADYGGPPPCEEVANAIPLSVGSNPVDTSMSGNDFVSECGDQSGSGPDQLLQFVAPAAGQFTFALTGADFDAWLLQSNYYCYTVGEEACVPNQSLDIDLVEGQTLYLILDGASNEGGTVSVDITQG
jgi:hypothetical protein